MSEIDLAAIKQRRERFDSLSEHDFNGTDYGELISDDFWSNIKDDEAALIEEIERLWKIEALAFGIVEPTHAMPRGFRCAVCFYGRYSADEYRRHYDDCPWAQLQVLKPKEGEK